MELVHLFPSIKAFCLVLPHSLEDDELPAGYHLGEFRCPFAVEVARLKIFASPLSY
jgi:hypothetical protein